MKIGILTFQNANNYGAVFQSYALQKYLLNNHIDCELINYDMEANKNQSKKDILVNSLKKKVLFMKNKNEYTKRKKFDQFRKDYLIIGKKRFYTDNQLYNNNFNYNKIIVGSDQVWNSKITNNSKIFYLDFIKNKNIQKISYAASFGHDELDKSEVENIKKYLNDFNKISVREEQIIPVIKKHIKKDIICTLDPVFLLNKKEWEAVSKKYETPKKYIFIYLMENVNYIQKIIDQINPNKEYKILYVCGGKNIMPINGQKIENIGPSEFIYILNNASYVITNSFHGTAFSIIMQKNFFVIEHSKYNARIYNIMNSAKKVHNILPYNDYVKKEATNGSEAYDLIKEKINDSKKFIKDNIISEAK